MTAPRVLIADKLSPLAQKIFDGEQATLHACHEGPLLLGHVVAMLVQEGCEQLRRIQRL